MKTKRRQIKKSKRAKLNAMRNPDVGQMKLKWTSTAANLTRCQVAEIKIMLNDSY